MGLPDEAAAGLPAPRDDEPATLREDLVDELADHLNCAMQRELRKNGAPEEAVKQVRKRFGDPRAVLRKLWFDAMKEKIMSQRLTIAAILLLAVSSMAATAFAWTALRDSRATAAAIQESNAALLEKMTELLATRPAAVTPPATNSDWTHVKFQLVLDEPKKSPAVGYSVSLTGKGGAAGEFSAGKKVSDDSGIVDFGLLPAAPYEIQISTPWNEWTDLQPLLIPPGEIFQQQLICPKNAIPVVELQLNFEVGWLEGKQALIICDFQGNDYRNIGDRGWRGGPQIGKSLRVVLDPSGRAVQLPDLSSAGWQMSVVSSSGDQFNNGDVQQGAIAVSNAFLNKALEGESPKSTVKAAAVDYRLMDLMVVPLSALQRQSGRTFAGSANQIAALRFRPKQDFQNDTAFHMHPSDGGENRFTILLPSAFATLAKEFIAASDEVRTLDRVPIQPGTEKIPKQMWAVNFLNTIGCTYRGMGTSSSPHFLGGILLADIRHGSPAEAAGIREHDLLVGMHNYETPLAEDLGLVSQRLAPNDKVAAFLVRGTQVVRIELTIPADWSPSGETKSKKKDATSPDASANRLEKPGGPDGDNQTRGDGIQFLDRLGITKLSRMISSEGKSNVTGSTSQTTKFRGGLRVEEIKADSPAGKAGMQSGDILVGLDKYETTTTGNIAWIMSRHEKSLPMKFHIVRNQQTLWGQLHLPDDWPAKADVWDRTGKPNAD